MKFKYLGVVLLFVTLLSLIINFNSFLMGRASSLLGIGITILYIVSWSLFVKFSRYNKKALVFSIAWSLSTLACATTTLVANINDALNVTFIIPFAIVFITPLYAIESLFSQSGFLLESIALIIISSTWFAISFIFFKRAK